MSEINTLEQLIEKRRNKGETGNKSFFHSESEDYDFYFKKCKPSFYYDLMEQFPMFNGEIDVKAVQEQGKINMGQVNMKNVYMMNVYVIYECTVIDNCKTLKDKDVQKALGINPKDPDLIENTVLAYLGSQKVEEYADAIINFSGLNDEKN